MPTLNDLKKSNYLTKADCGRGILVTISGYQEENLAKEGTPPEMKYTLSFHEVEKPLVLNITNGNIIASITKSEDFNDWIGHKIVLYDDPNISFAGKLTGGIRVRAPRIQAAPVAKPQPAPPAAPNPAPPAQSLAEPGDDDVPF